MRKIISLISLIILFLPFSLAAFDVTISEVSVLDDGFKQKTGFLAGETFYVKVKMKNLGDDITYGKMYLKCEYSGKADSYPCKGDGFYYKYNPLGKQIELKNGEEITFFAQGTFYDTAMPSTVDITAYVDPEGVQIYNTAIKKTSQVEVANNEDWEAAYWSGITYVQGGGYPMNPPTAPGPYGARVNITKLNQAKTFSGKFKLNTNNSCYCNNSCNTFTYTELGTYLSLSNCTFKVGKNCIYVTAKDSQDKIVLAEKEYCLLSTGYTDNPTPNTTAVIHTKVNVTGNTFSNGTVSCNYISDKKQYECTAKLIGYQSVEYSFDKPEFNDPANLKIIAEPAEMFAYKKGSVNIFGDPNSGARKYIITLLTDGATGAETVSGADLGILESLLIVIISVAISFAYVRRTRKSFSGF
ncbi:MAG: hypothetical protein COT15_00505 [Candidatus Diapherotrites archaeon CG08_land_8_20_14_0_20_34_12]|nr:MAG: hypothetical protein COT15_00505 [Candidatus Diapherotrites archaeon CG08_land_8_20_14_0_20_34_12]